MVEAIGTGDAFRKGRDFAPWLGLAPKQNSTGDRTILGRISKRKLSENSLRSGRQSRAAEAANWTVLSTSYFLRDGGPRRPAIDLA